jgi:hypothetical protein
MMRPRWLEDADSFTSFFAAEDSSYKFAFCKRLYLGFKDAWVALLLHLIPNVRDICFLHVPSHDKTLPWKVSISKLPDLRRLVAFSEED